jgi:hypothetical protein
LFLVAPAELLFGLNWQQPRVVLTCGIAAATAALLITLVRLAPQDRFQKLSYIALAWCLVGALPAQSLLDIPPVLTGSRVLYFSSIGAALLMAILLARIDSPSWRLCWTALLVLCFTLATHHNISAWTHASTVTDDFLLEVQQEVPNPGPNAELVIHDMPRATRGGIYLLLHVGLADGIRYQYKRDDLTARRSDEPPDPSRREQVDLYWRGDWRDNNRPLVTTSPARD